MTPWAATCRTPRSFTISQSLLKLMSVESSLMLSNNLILCYPILFLPSIFPSIKVFTNELALCIRWPKYWNLSFSASPSNEYSGLISFRIDWFDLLLSKGLSSLLQHHNPKHQFFGTQPSLRSTSHIFTWLLENHSCYYMNFCQQSDVSAF